MSGCVTRWILTGPMPAQPDKQKGLGGHLRGWQASCRVTGCRVTGTASRPEARTGRVHLSRSVVLSLEEASEPPSPPGGLTETQMAAMLEVRGGA